MKINTTFNVGDTAYVLEDNSCYKVKITEIDVNVDEEGVEVGYDVEKEIPRGLLRTDTENTCYQEEELFPSKQDVKDKLKEIEEHKKKSEGLEWYMKDDSRNYFNITNPGYIKAATALNIKTI